MRNDAIDLSRGLLMIYIIILIHGSFWLNLIPRQFSSILLFEMPLIFLISGYTFGLTNTKSSYLSLASYWIYFKARLSRILLPYTIYSLVCICIVNYFSKSTVDITMILSWINPFLYGDGYTFSTLNWHLWFIAPFLVVALLMPLLKILSFKRTPPFYLFIILCLLFIISNFHLRSFSTYFFYYLWAFLGYELSLNLRFSNKQLLTICISSAILLFILHIIFNINLDMQSNKFPPNIIFLVFSFIWTSLIIYISSKIPSDIVNRAVKNKFIKIFITYGYSIYLWQGLGYAIAIYLQNKYLINIPVYDVIIRISTLLIAIFITILLGLLASPIERIRWKQSTLS